MRVLTLRLISSILLFLSAGVMFAGSPIWSIWPTGNAINKSATPVFSPGSFSSVCHANQTITISTSTVGASIRYNKSTTGTPPADPTCSSGTLISGTSGTTSAGLANDTIIKAVSFTNCGGSPDTSNVALGEWDFTC